MANNIYGGTADRPYHISVGAVVYDEEGKICCHYVGPQKEGSRYYPLADFYTLMHETLEPGETLEHAVVRGIQEELGVTGENQGFIGTIMSGFYRGETLIEKTSLYFLVKLTKFDLGMREPEHDDFESEIRWIPMDELIAAMQKQAEIGKSYPRFSNFNTNASVMLKRAKELIGE